MTRPNAFNSWQGNDFIIPGLPVRPTYSTALTPKDDTGAVSDTLAQLGFRVDDAGRGSGEGLGGINNGQQETRQADSLADWATSTAKGVSMMGPIGLATGLYGASQMTADKQTHPNWGWGDFAKAVVPGGGLFDAFGGGGTFSGPGGANRNAGPTFGGVGPIDEQAYQAMVDTGFGGGGNTVGNSSEFGADHGDMYNKGGTVRALRGPNPPGPDDGFGGLQRGEEVVSRKNVSKLKGKYGPDLFEMIHKGRLPARR